MPLLFIVLLLGNLLVAGWLLFSQIRLGRRIGQLEANATAVGERTRTNGRQFATERPTLAGRQERIAVLLAAATDAEATRRLLNAMPPGERVEIARALIRRPAENDRNVALGALLQKITEDDPGEAVTFLASIPEVGLQQSFAAQIAAAWIDQDPAASATWLAGPGQTVLERVARDRLLTAAVSRWAAFDPAAAARFTGAKAPTSEEAAQLLRAVAREWAGKDPAAALAWAQNFATGDPRKVPAFNGVLEGWTDKDPAQAAGYVGQISYGAGRSYGGEAAAVAARWAERDPAAAGQWAAGLTDRTVRRDALRQVALSWAASDVQSAARWAAALPASRERAGIWQGICEDWTGINPAGAETWLTMLPTGNDRDATVAAYAAKMVPADPEKALTWAKTISNADFAVQQIQNLLAEWSRKDPLAARNWAAANQLQMVLPDNGR